MFPKISSNRPRPQASHWRRGRGSALVIVLALVVLLTFLIVAFLTRSQTDLVASSNYSKSVQADEVAQYGSTFLIANLQQEIRQAMSVTGPKATVWPARVVAADGNSGGDPANPAVDEQNPREFLPFRISSALQPDFDKAYGAGAAAKLPPNVASDVRTDAGSRAFEPSRWNAPRLLPYTPRIGSNWVNCPTWVYVTRSGPKSLTAGGTYGATLDKMKNVTDPANTDAVIGRFAYIMYDVGGLLDASIAGAPLSGDQLADPLCGEKGSTAFANLKTLFSSTTVANAGDAAGFLAWRTPTASGYHDAVAGKDLSKVGLMERGMLDAPGNGNIFFSRQDLIRFSNDNPNLLRGGRSYRVSGGVDSDSGILKFFRTRSRSMNAPMVDDALPYPAAAGDPRLADANTTIPRYKVESTSGAERDDYVILKGEPLFQRKFPLSRIRWFSNNDETGQPKAEVRAAIKQHFGLTPASDLSNYTTSPEWAGVPGFVYTSPDGTTPATKIKTLAEVAALKREPDFFEWLKAAIDSDTLGLDAGWTSSDVAMTQDQSKDFQIIQIGANILDQVDVNDLPTLILTSVDGVNDRNSQPLVALGVENVPYINEMIVSVKREGDWGSTDAENVSAWLQPEIWMPHYNDTAVSTLAGYNNPNEIDAFRVRVVDGVGWLNLFADYQIAGKTLSAVYQASQDFRTIEPREFHGSTTASAGKDDDSLVFSLADEDFRDPKLPGQSSAPNSYNNGPINGTAVQLRECFAGPEPGADGFKGIFAGRATNCGIVPGPSGGRNYSDRRYWFLGGSYQLNEAEDGCLRDPNGPGAVDGDSDGIPDPLTSMASFPMGQKYYNNFNYLTLATSGNKPRNSPSGNPRPLTVMLEAKAAGDSWVPVQILERVTFGWGTGGITLNPSGRPTSARSGQAWDPGFDATGYKNFTNILSAGECVPGYNYNVLAVTSDQVNRNASFPGLLCYFQKANGGLASGGAQVPEWLGWCRPVLADEDPDPGNAIYPLGGTVAARQAINRNDSDKRNTNQYLATNENIGKDGAGGGHEQRFGSLYFGWSTIWNRLSVIKADPRTRRFGEGGTIGGGSGGSSIRPISGLLNADDQSGANWDVVEVGAPGKNWDPATGLPTQGALYPNWHTLYFRAAGAIQPNMAIADLMRNLTTGACYYEEPAGSGKTVRPADYAYAPDDELPTLPTQTYSAALKARPVVLNRMFRSPAELGQVFRDVPWKSLDFFSEAAVSGTTRTPASGDTALLDVFCIEDSDVAAGRVDPNKAPQPVLEALVSGALEYPGRDIATVTDAVTTPEDIQNIVAQFLDTVSYNAANPLNSTSLGRDSDIVAALMTCDAVKPTTGAIKQKSAAEAIIRSLSGSTDTRTWNIFIDIIAEAGRLPGNATKLGDFVASAQRRCWIFVAFDRITGRVIDYHYEVVNE